MRVRELRKALRGFDGLVEVTLREDGAPLLDAYIVRGDGRARVIVATTRAALKADGRLQGNRDGL